MTTMALEDVAGYSFAYVKERVYHWRNEYPDLDIWLGSFQGRKHIIATDEVPC
jgi:hypothetical protein